MSFLQKDLFKHKTGHSSLPSLPNQEEEVIEEEGDTFGNLGPAVFRPRGKLNFSPVPWNNCYESFRDLKLPGTEDIFRVYEAPATTEKNAPIFVFHHGAGYSSLSFALCVSHIRRAMEGSVSILAYDCRGHGATRTSDDTNLSLERLSQDLADVVNFVFGGEGEVKKRDIFLIGHSMGGCVVAHAASNHSIPSVVCVAVLDVVEGSAMEALSGMSSFLRTRPTEFKSIEHAIEWSVKSGTIHNLASSRVSIPSLFTEESDPNTGMSKLVWRTNLAATQKYWEGWFIGMSEKFLASKAAKLLILAGPDRLDKPLTIAQMQGKYQLIVLPDVGHMLQEDAPDRTANALVDFYKRNEKLVLPLKRLTL